MAQGARVHFHHPANIPPVNVQTRHYWSCHLLWSLRLHLLTTRTQRLFVSYKHFSLISPLVLLQRVVLLTGPFWELHTNVTGTYVRKRVFSGDKASVKDKTSPVLPRREKAQLIQHKGMNDNRGDGACIQLRHIGVGRELYKNGGARLQLTICR